MRRQTIAWLYLLPGLAGLAAFFVVPFVISFRYIFGAGVADIRFAGLDNFKALLGNQAFHLAAKNTAIFIAAAVPLLTVCSFLLALYLDNSRFVRASLLMPMMMPVASALLGWSAVFGSDGVLSRLLGGVDFLADPYARWVMIFIFFIKNLGYMTIIFSGAIAGIPRELREAFSLDSGSTLQYARHVAAPMVSPVIFFVVILSMVNCFQIFREVYGLYGNDPTRELYMLQSFMNNNFLKLNYNRLCTASFLVTMLIAALISVYLFYQRKLEKEGRG